MFCVECGTKNVDKARFCENCGAKMRQSQYIPPVMPPMQQPLQPQPQQSPQQPLPQMQSPQHQTPPEQFVWQQMPQQAVHEQPPQTITEQQQMQQPPLQQPPLQPPPLQQQMQQQQPPQPQSQQLLQQQQPLPQQPSLQQHQHSQIPPQQPHPQPLYDGDYYRQDKFAIWREMVGPNTEYYFSAFREVAARRESFNWSAFFFGGIIMVYRKMYGAFFGYYFIPLLLAMASAFGLTLGFITNNNTYALASYIVLAAFVLIWFIISFVVGSKFNSMYFNKLKRLIAENRLDGSPHQQNVVKKLGGTAAVSSAIMFIIILGLLIGSAFAGQYYAGNMSQTAIEIMSDAEPAVL